MGKRYKILVLVLLIAGLALSFLSGTNICNFSGCSENHQYRLYGLPFPSVGIFFFTFSSLLVLTEKRIPGAITLFNLMLAGGAGSEINMILHQKNVVHAWCPFCLGIAAIIYLLAGAQIINYINYHKEEFQMNAKWFLKPAMLGIAVLVGFSLTFSGIAKSDTSAGPLNLYLGKQNSNVEIYLFSDWLCPACSKVEGVIEPLYPLMAKKARILFVDKIIHPEAVNFVPYHLSFLLHEKGKYMQLRKALFALAKKTKNPTYEDVKAAIAPLQVTYKQLTFMEVTQQMAASQKLATTYNVRSTPTMVIRNSKTGKLRILAWDKITPEAINSGIKEME